MRHIETCYSRYICGGDTRWLDDLLEAARRIALSTALRLRCVDPEEVAQQATLRVWQNLRSYDPSRASLKTWICSITRRISIDHHRSAPPQAEDIDKVTSLLSDSPRFETLSINSHHLSAEDRRTLAVFILDPNFEAAAETLGVTVPALKKRLHRMIAKNSCDLVPL